MLPPAISPAPDTPLTPVLSPAVDTSLPPVTSPPPPPVTSPPVPSPATDSSLPLLSPPPLDTSPSPPPGPSPILTPPPTRKPPAPLPPESHPPPPPKPSNSPAAEKPNRPPPKPSNSSAAEKPPNRPPPKPSNSPAAGKPNRSPPPLPSITRPSKSPPAVSNIPSPTISSPIPLPPASTIPSPAISSAISSPPAPKLASPLLPPTSSISSPSPSSSKNGSLPTALQIQKPQQNQSTGLIAGGCIILGIVVLGVLLLSLACVYYRRRRRKKRRELDEDFPKATNFSPKDSSFSVLPQNSSNPPRANSSGVFTYDQLVVATEAFSESKLIGQGGFGLVYKGVLPSGKEVAVKQMKTGSRQGEREFQAEVDTITRVHHKHLVSLVGYCITGSERLLVYDFVPNDTLEFHLHGKREHVLEWTTRLKIAIGAAKGLAYLHGDCNPTIIHRDIKASNILLDFRFEAKVSDFGLARSCSDNSHISTRVVGTFGYLAPEYASSGKVTEKSDVYSYGVVLLELITGRTPITTTESLRNEGLVEWARPLLARALELGDFDALVDPKLEGNYSDDEMARMVACAAVCVRHSAWLRPRMSLIVHTLEGHASLTDLHEGITPGNSTFFNSSGNSNYNANQYKHDIHNFNITIADQASASGSSMQSGSTSEYGIIPSLSSSEAQQTFRNQ
ncbi:hypothetical protein UlMin_035015 [Ulmus minor]